MKNPILFLAFFSFLLAKAHGAGLESILFSQQQGTCESHDLSFTALRFTKIPLKSEGENIYLRLLFFIHENKTETVRLTVQEKLGCQLTNEGEVCSYRPLKNHWLKGEWNLTEDGVETGSIGSIKIEKDSFKISIHLSSVFPYQELRGETFMGSMVKVNFNDEGISTDKICAHE